MHIILLLLLICGCCHATDLVMAARIDEVRNLNPHRCYDTRGIEILHNIYETLFYNNYGNIESHILEQWDYKENELNFKIYPGKNFNIDDVIASLKNSGIEEISDVIKIDQLHGIISFKDKYNQNYLLAKLCSIQSSVIDANYVTDDNWLNTHSAGFGKYRISEFRPSQYIILEHINNKDKLIIKNVNNPSLQEILFAKGEVNVARNVTPLSITKEFKANDVSENGNSMYYLAINQQRPYLQNKEVVSAIKKCVDTKSMVNALFKNHAIASTSIYPLNLKLGYEKESIYTKNIIPISNQELPVLNLLVKNLALGQVLQHYLSKIGIKSKIITGDGNYLLTRFRNKEYDLFVGSWSSDYLDFHCNAHAFLYNPTDNQSKTLAWRTHWNPEGNVHELLRAAIIESDLVIRKDIYKKLYDHYLNEAPILVMFHMVEHAIVDKAAKGFVLGSDISSTRYDFFKD